MIAFRDVSARYPNAEKRALDGVAFNVDAGQITAVVGPNGSGKSTLVRALLRRVNLEAGSIDIDGLDIASMQPGAIATSVAVLPQREDPVFPLAVQGYVGLGRYPRLGIWKSETSADAVAVHTAMQRAEITEFALRKTDQISGGEWQRVRIARALAQESGTIVLDEPTTSLDVAHEMALFELLDDLSRDGLAIMVVSHELNLVARFASRIVLLRDGRVVAAGTPSEVMQTQILEQVFDWPLRVIHDEVIAAPALFPLRQKTQRHSTRTM